MKPVLIAEVKTISPFGYRSTKTWDELLAIANTHGDWISIHTDPRWGGSLDLVTKARALTKKPILAKGIHATDEDLERAFAAGADYALVVGRIPNIPHDQLLFEPRTLAELSDYPPNTKVVWNTRDLATGDPKRETITDARRVWSGWLCQASMISSSQDLCAGIDALLVGEHLEQFIASLPDDSL